MNELHSKIVAQKRALDNARLKGDKLHIDLAEAALNYLLDKRLVTFVTGNNKGETK